MDAKQASERLERRHAGEGEMDTLGRPVQRNRLVLSIIQEHFGPIVKVRLLSCWGGLLRRQ